MKLSGRQISNAARSAAQLRPACGDDQVTGRGHLGPLARLLHVAPPGHGLRARRARKTGPSEHGCGLWPTTYGAIIKARRLAEEKACENSLLRWTAPPPLLQKTEPPKGRAPCPELRTRILSCAQEPHPSKRRRDAKRSTMRKPRRAALYVSSSTKRCCATTAFPGPSKRMEPVTAKPRWRDR